MTHSRSSIIVPQYQFAISARTAQALLPAGRLEQDQAKQGDRVANNLELRYGFPEYEYGAADEQNVLENASESENKAAASTDEEDGGDVEEEGDGSV